MKYRIVASILVIAVVLALGVVFSPQPTNHNSTEQSTSTSEPSFSGLGK